MNAPAPNITTIPQGIREAADRHPDGPAFHWYDGGWKALSYREFFAGAGAVSGHLRDAGLRPGDRAAILCENGPEWCRAYLSIVLASGVAVPIDPQLGAEEMGNLLRDSGAEVLFHSRKTLETIETYLRNAPAGPGGGIRLINIDSPGYRTLLAMNPPEDLPAAAPDDIASIIYTSGTTGRPKGVVLTQANFCADAAALIGAGLVTSEDNVLSVLPLHHTYAFMCTFLVPLLLGASITYPASLKGPDLTAAMSERGVSVLIGVPQLLAMIRNGILSKMEDFPRPLALLSAGMLRLCGFVRELTGMNIGRVFFSSAHRAFGPRFRFIGSGGARLDPAVMRDLEALGFTVLEGYGLTETAPVVTFNPMAKRKPGSAGSPLPSVELRIHGAEQEGSEGEIELRGPMVMRGYYRNPVATEEAIRDGWLRTGDIGRLDKDGYLFITGRSKEVIVLGSGKNIYPEDVERLYSGSPLIKELCVTVADEKEEALHAIVVPDFEYARTAKIPDIREAIKWEISGMSARVSPSMRVTGFSIRREPLPRTALGKIRRFLLRGEPGRPAAPVEEGPEETLPGELPRKIAAELRRFVKEGRRIGLDDDLELDVGLDSLAKIELAASLEKSLGANIPDNFFSNIHTVRELIDGVMELTVPGEQTGGPEGAGWKDILSGELPGEDLALVSLEPPESRMLPSRMVFSILKLLSKICFRLEARGTENLPKTGNFILAANHTSYLDGFVVILSLPFAEFRNLYSLGLSEFFAGPVKGRFSKIAHVIPIDSSVYLGRALQISAHVMKNGRSLLVFPEGGRSVDGTLLEFRKGVGILSAEMEVPAVPVYIDGAFEALPKGAFLPRFRKITVVFGRPLRAQEVPFRAPGKDRYEGFAAELRERVRELADRGREE